MTAPAPEQADLRVVALTAKTAHSSAYSAIRRTGAAERASSGKNACSIRTMPNTLVSNSACLCPAVSSAGLDRFGRRRDTGVVGS
jgi:hypothetical protein